MAQQATRTGGHCQGLNHIWGPNQHNPSARQASKSKVELELMCLAEVGHRFTQASHMPFLLPPLVEIFMESNVHTSAFEQVLQGTFEFPIGIDPMTEHLIKALD